MKRFAFVLLLLVVVGCATTNPNMGKSAPDFALVDLSDRVVKLEDFRGKNLVLVFYVSYNWQPCLQQLGELQSRISEIRELDAEIIAIATRGNRNNEEKTKKAFNITFTIIPGPERKTAEAFGVWNNTRQLAIATVIVDKSGVIRFIHEGVSDFDRPNASDVIKKLKEINQAK